MQITMFLCTGPAAPVGAIDFLGIAHHLIIDANVRHH